MFNTILRKLSEQPTYLVRKIEMLDKATKKNFKTGVQILTAVTQISRGETNVISAKAQNRKALVTAAAVAAEEVVVVAEVVTAETEGVSETIEADVEVIEVAEAAAVSVVETEVAAEDEAVP